jgi:hypothetical protein
MTSFSFSGVCFTTSLNWKLTGDYYEQQNDAWKSYVPRIIIIIIFHKNNQQVFYKPTSPGIVYMPCSWTDFKNSSTNE